MQSIVLLEKLVLGKKAVSLFLRVLGNADYGGIQARVVDCRPRGVKENMQIVRATELEVYLT
jgi:hypothetical protein